MLKPIFETNLTEDQKYGKSLIDGWIALDEASGAFLIRTHGHGKGGLPTYVLILPNKTPIERGGLLASYQWDYPKGRKFIREWSDGAAIISANKKLSKMLST